MTALIGLEDHEFVARYVGASKFDLDTLKPLIDAFDRDAKDANGLSFNRTGLLDVDPAKDADCIRGIMMSRMELGKNAVFAELNVGSASATLRKFGEGFQFISDPLLQEGEKLANPVHALLTGLPLKGESAGSLKSDHASLLLTREVRRIFWAHPSKADLPLGS